MQPSNLLKIESLNEDWCDKDHVMLHACFQLLKNCVENEKLLDGHIDWDFNAQYKEAKNELQALYDWWIFRSSGEQQHSLEDENEFKKDNEMLHRLIEVRWTLWT